MFSVLCCLTVRLKDIRRSDSMERPVFQSFLVSSVHILRSSSVRFVTSPYIRCPEGTDEP